jgi:hypothetical protein
MFTAMSKADVERSVAAVVATRDPGWTKSPEGSGLWEAGARPLLPMAACSWQHAAFPGLQRCLVELKIHAPYGSLLSSSGEALSSSLTATLHRDRG